MGNVSVSDASEDVTKIDITADTINKLGSTNPIHFEMMLVTLRDAQPRPRGSMQVGRQSFCVVWR